MKNIHFAVLHLEKYKQKDLYRLGRHIDRNKIQFNVEPQRTHLNEELSHILGQRIHTERSTLNENLIPTHYASLQEAVEARIQAAYTYIRKGCTKVRALNDKDVRAVGVILTGSHLRMKQIEDKEPLFQEWKKQNYLFACQEFGQDNIVRFTLHRDEKTPHIHCFFVPITKKGSLSAKAYMQGPQALSALQDRYAKAMTPFDLQRGIQKEKTGLKHIPTQLFRRDQFIKTQLITQQLHTQFKDINSINPLKRAQAQKQKEILFASLAQAKAENEHWKLKNNEKDHTLQNLTQKDSHYALESVKKHVNLLQHIASMGYQINLKKSTKHWAIMEKEHDTLLVKAYPNKKGQWYYQSLVNEQDKGSIVDFMTHRGYNLKNIAQLSSLHLDPNVLIQQQKCPQILHDPIEQTKMALQYFNNINKNTDKNFLQAKGISTKTYQPYLGKNLNIGTKTVFALYQQLDAQGKGRLCSTVSYLQDQTGETKKFFQKGLPRGIAVLKDNDKVEKILFTHCPIRALRHKQQHNEPNTTLYLATCGNLTKQIRAEIKAILEDAKLHAQPISIVLDNEQTAQHILPNNNQEEHNNSWNRENTPTDKAQNRTNNTQIELNLNLIAKILQQLSQEDNYEEEEIPLEIDPKKKKQLYHRDLLDSL